MGEKLGWMVVVVEEVEKRVSNGEARALQQQEEEEEEVGMFGEEDASADETESAREQARPGRSSEERRLAASRKHCGIGLGSRGRTGLLEIGEGSSLVQYHRQKAAQRSQ